MGKCIIFSAPSGAGKTTIVKSLLGSNPNLEFSISACSRAQRENEVNGRDYYFLSVSEFKHRIANNEFIEWEEVYTDNFYGTLKTEIERVWSHGKHVIFDVDVQGGINLKKEFGAKALSVFVMPPSIQHLEERLRVRGSETPESLKRRMDKAAHELGYAPEFDFILYNDDLELACMEAKTKVEEFLAG